MIIKLIGIVSLSIFLVLFIYSFDNICYSKCVWSKQPEVRTICNNLFFGDKISEKNDKYNDVNGFIDKNVADNIVKKYYNNDYSKFTEDLKLYNEYTIIMIFTSMFVISSIMFTVINEIAC